MARYFDGANDQVLYASGSVAGLDSDVKSISVWARLPALPTSIDAIIHAHQAGDFNWFVRVDNVSSSLRFVFRQKHLLASGTWTTSNSFSLNAWHHILFTYDDNPANDPIFYIDGIAESLTENNAPSGARATGLDGVSIGATSLQALDFKGDIGEMAVWQGIILTAGEAKALAGGVPANRVQRGSLKFYAPLHGYSPEPEIVQGYQGTVNGTVVSDHPPVAPPFGFDHGWQGMFTEVAAVKPYYLGGLAASQRLNRGIGWRG